MTVSLMAQVQSIDDKAVFVFVGDARKLITRSGWSRSLLMIGMGVMVLIFAICRVVSNWFAVPLTLLVKESI